MNNPINLLDLAESHFKDSNYKMALEACESYLIEYPNDISGLRLKAKSLERMGDVAQAIATISLAISHSTQAEPCDYFYKGRWNLSINNLSDALKDFTQVIEIGEKFDYTYYQEDAYLHRAYSFMLLNQRDKFILDLAHIGDEVRTYIHGRVISKELLVSTYLR